MITYRDTHKPDFCKWRLAEVETVGKRKPKGATMQDHAGTMNREKRGKK
jgi:hypothetical protein